MNPIPNTQTGIQLIQAGKHAEALTYLRRAAQSEAVSPEVWLWLAHVTPDPREYQHCIQQALAMNPAHQVALQMRQAFEQAYPQLATINAPSSGGISQSMQVDARLIAAMEKKNRSRRRRRIIMALLVLIILILLGVVALSLADKDSSADGAEKMEGKTIEVGLSQADETWRFSVQVPPSWLLANSVSSDWMNAREILANRFAEHITIWQQVESKLSDVQINAQTGAVQPPITIIEVNPSNIERDNFHPARLQLVRFVTLQATNSTCSGLERFASEHEDELAPNRSVVEYGVKQTGDNRCIFMVHYLDESPLSQELEHIYVFYVPADNGHLAEWHLTVLASAHDFYQDDIQQILKTLRPIS